MTLRATPPPFRLESSLLYQFAVISHRASSQVHAPCRTRYGLSVAAWRVMVHVAERHPVTAKEIGQRAAMDSVSLSRALNLLDECGFVERRIDPSDRRRIIPRLTLAGQTVDDEVIPQTIACEQALLTPLEAAERTLLRKLMKKVGRHSAALDGPRAGDEMPP